MFGLDKEEILKGENPHADRVKKRKQRSLKEKFRDYCQYHHWNRSEQLKQFSNIEDGDGYVKPTFTLFMYNIWMNFIDKTPYYNMKYLLQKIFRKNHIADRELWNVGDNIARIALKYIMKTGGAVKKNMMQKLQAEK